MALLTEQDTISHAERVPGILHLAWNLKVVFNRNTMLWIIMVSCWMLSEAPLIIYIHLRKVLKHSSSNCCLFSCRMPLYFSCWEGICVLTFYMKFECYSWQEWNNVDHNELVYAFWTSYNHLKTSKERYETLKQQWISLLAAKHPISNADKVSVIWNCVRIWG